MIQPVVEQLVRLQRGIQAFDATTGRKMVICGGLVMGTGDNPAASDLCAHNWQSNRPCRVCLFNRKKVSSYVDVYQSAAARSPVGTRSANSAQREELGMKKSLTTNSQALGLDVRCPSWRLTLLCEILVESGSGGACLLQEANNDDFAHRLN